MKSHFSQSNRTVSSSVKTSLLTDSSFYIWIKSSFELRIDHKTDGQLRWRRTVTGSKTFRWPHSSKLHLCKFPKHLKICNTWYPIRFCSHSTGFLRMLLWVLKFTGDCKFGIECGLHSRKFGEWVRNFAKNSRFLYGSNKCTCTAIHGNYNSDIWRWLYSLNCRGLQCRKDTQNYIQLL